MSFFVACRYSFWIVLIAISILFNRSPALAERTQPQVSDREMQRFLASFSKRPKPVLQPRTNYRKGVNRLQRQGIKVAWFVGKWRTPDGFVAIFPSNRPGRACVLSRTKRMTSYVSGTVQKGFLRADTLLYIHHNGQLLKYATSDVFMPVIHREQAYLVWGLYDPSSQRPRFLTLGFESLPPAPKSFLPTDRSAKVIQSAFLADGCCLPTHLTRTAEAMSGCGVLTLQIVNDDSINSSL